ncbi:hypothetical protein CK203_019617 [Vitis vinifera]|uniref:Uncharacterized protein n=1 Tax=Vitis vinifera TaxID=29760 RepID=A0A438JQV6_VITVI|nr:hypothetical protein CK203_019617 [Vitis vinifera]
MEGGLLTQLAPKLYPPMPPHFNMDLHCSYHQGPRHDTGHYASLRHAIQDLIDQGLFNLGLPSVTTNPLSAHSTHAVPPPLGGSHSGFSDFYPFSLILDWVPFELTPTTPLATHIVTQRESSSASTLVARPFDGAISHEVEEYYRHWISIWSLLASSSTHRDALIRLWPDYDLPPEGSNHTRPLYITVGCSGHRVPSVLLDNGSTFNVCPLATAIALGYAPLDFGPSTQTVRAYDSTKRESWADLGFIGSGLFHFPSSEVMSFDQHSSTVVLDMMREANYRYMARLHRERVRARLTYTPFDYPVRPYRMSLVDYFVRGSELGDETSGAPVSVMIAPSSQIEPTSYLFVPHDEYRDEMDMISMSQIAEMVQPELASSFDMFEGVTIEVAEEIQTVLAPELMEDVVVGDDMFEDTFSSIEGASDFVDHLFHLKFYRIHFRSDDVYDSHLWI